VLWAAERVALGAPARDQVEELPVIATRVIEHRCQRVRCPACGAQQTGVLPAEVAGSAFGPRLPAAVATLSVRNRLSRRDVVELCEQLFRARISTGSVEAIPPRAGDALELPYADLLDRLRRAKALNMDETGWRLAVSAGRSGAPSPSATRCCGSPRIVTRTAPARCSPTVRRL
jgi:transposase